MSVLTCSGLWALGNDKFYPPKATSLFKKPSRVAFGIMYSLGFCIFLFSGISLKPHEIQLAAIGYTALVLLMNIGMLLFLRNLNEEESDL